jgi:hypothetical protein
MGQTFGVAVARPQLAELVYSERHEQYVPTRTTHNAEVFRRDGEDRDALDVRSTSLAYVKKSEHLKRPRVLLNERGEPERRRSVDGDGLYAAQTLPPFSVVGEYRGAIIADAADAKGASNYRFAVRDLRNGRTLHTIDGENKEVSSIARYANAADTLEQVNAEFVQFRRRVFLVATRKIRAHEEIITWYGEDTEVINASPKDKRAPRAPKRDVFLLDRIVGRRKRAGKDEFLVKWQGYTDKHDSWEPEENIFDEAELRRARKLPVSGV